MILARWRIEARFGHKQAVIDSMQEWHRTIGSQVGWTDDKVRLSTGSIGAPEACVEAEITLQDLAELDAAWAKLATLDAHKAWSKKLEPDVVPGSHRWEILRLL